MAEGRGGSGASSLSWSGRGSGGGRHRHPPRKYTLDSRGQPLRPWRRGRARGGSGPVRVAGPAVEVDGVDVEAEGSEGGLQEVLRDEAGRGELRARAADLSAYMGTEIRQSMLAREWRRARRRDDNCDSTVCLWFKAILFLSCLSH